MHPQNTHCPRSTSPRQASRYRLAVAGLAAALSALAAQAQSSGTYTSTNGAWNLTGSWQGGVIATGTDSTAFFTNDVVADQTTSLGGNRTIGNIVFTDADTASAGNRILGSNTLTLDVTTGSPTIDVTQSNRTFRITSALTGNDGLIKTGPGALTLNSGSSNPSTNTLSGPIQILQGIIQYGNANLGGTTTGVHTVAISAGATLRFRHAGTDVVTYTADISGAGGVHFNYNNLNSGGSLTLVGNNTFTGGLNVAPTSGTNVLSLKAGGPTSLGAGNVTIGQYGRLDLNGHSPVTGLLIGASGGFVTNDGALPGTLTLQSNDATARSFNGVLQDGASVLSLAKAGTGTQILTGLNTYTGSTTVTGGTLRLTNNNTLSDTRAVNLATGGILELAHTGTDTVGALSIDGAFQPAGTYGRIGSGAQFETALITGDGLINNLNNNDAVVHYWDGTGSSWSSAASWTTNPANAALNPPAAPGTAGVPIFGADGVAAGTVGLGGDQSVFGLSFVSPVVFTFTGGGASSDLSLGAGGINLDADAGGAVFGSAEANQDADVVIAANQTWTNGNAAADVSTLNTLNLGGNTLTLAGAGSFTVNGPVAGTGSFAFTGAGNRTVASAISGIGSTTFTGTGTTVFSNTFASTGTIGKRGTGILEFSGSAVSTGDLTADGGTLTFTGTGTVAPGNITVRGAGDTGTAFNAVGATVTFGAGTITTLASDKTIQIGNVITTGGSTVQNLNANGTLTHDGQLTVGRSGRLNVAGNWTQNGAINLTTYGGGVAAITVTAGGQFTYANSADFQLNSSTSTGSFTTRLTLDGGTATTGTKFHNNQTSNVAFSEVQINNGGTLRLSADIPDFFTTAGAASRVRFDGTGGTSGTFDTNGFSTTVNVPVLGTGGVIKTGGGTLTLAGARSYAGNTTVTGGNLVLAQDNTANDASTVSIDAGAFLTLGAGVVDTVDKLFLAGVQQPAGDYTSANSGLRILGEGTLRVLSSPITDPYIGWISGFSLALDQVDTTDDPDGDGLNNLLEFVLNGNPSVADTSVLPTVAVNGANLEITYQRRKDSVAGIVQTAQWGTTLSSWPGSAIIPAESGTVAPVTVTVSAGVPSDTVTDTVKVAIPMTESGGTGRLFGRLQAVKP